MSDRPRTDMIEQLAEIIGEEAALTLSARFGGRRLYVPKDTTRAAGIVGLIGPKAAELLVRRFGGIAIEMPLERGKRERIIMLTDRHWTVRQIAETIGCTERHVKYVRAEYLKHGGAPRDLPPISDPDQPDLFASDD